MLIRSFAKRWRWAAMKPFRINADSQDSFYIASQIAEIAKQGAYDLVLAGKETIDYNSASIGGMIAALLDLPYMPLAIKLEINGSTALYYKRN